MCTLRMLISFALEAHVHLFIKWSLVYYIKARMVKLCFKEQSIVFIVSEWSVIYLLTKNRNKRDLPLSMSVYEF